jgi:hypothetical protein
MTRMSPLMRVAVFVLLLLLTVEAPAVLHAAPASPRVVVLPAGIADTAGEIGYFASAAGGIEAIDLTTGEVRWESIEAQRPLLIANGRLLAQAGTRRNRLRVLAFDLAKNGECVFESDAVVLPSWVVTGEAPGRSFTPHWRLLDEQHLELSWEARAWFAGPGKPKAGQEEAARKQAAGVARIDLVSGRVEVREGEVASPSEEKFGLPEELEQKYVRWHGIAGGGYRALVLEEKEGEKEKEKQQVLMLYAWDLKSGESLPPLEMHRGKRLNVMVSLDRRHFLIREAEGPPDEGNMGGRPPKPVCWAFSLETGLPTAKLPYEPGMQSLVILGPNAYYLVGRSMRGTLEAPVLQPRILRAVDLKSGKKAWERPVGGKVVLPVNP